MRGHAIHLPVSGLEVLLREPAGTEDILLLETNVFDSFLAVELLSRIAFSPDGSEVEWNHLPFTDLDTALLQLRLLLLGERIQADVVCPSDGCSAPIEVSFDIRDYLAHNSPNQLELVRLDAESGWYQFKDSELSFRIPVVADCMAIANHPHPKQELIQRCIRPVDVKAKQVKRVEMALEEIAPSLAGTLQGTCVECKAEVEIFFDPQQFTLRELRNQAAFIYDDIHLLALYYQWSEAEILAIPRHRRMHYAEILREIRRAA